MSDDKVLPCPFCGEFPHVGVEYIREDREDIWQIMCETTNCVNPVLNGWGILTYELWNRRA